MTDETYKEPATNKLKLSFEPPVYKSFSWKPKDNITAKELADCIPVIIVASTSAGSFGLSISRMVAGLPEKSARHFEELK